MIDDILVLDTNCNITALVIDGGSTDNTLDICSRKNVKTIIQKGNGKGSALREAVNQTDADIVVFIDGDGTYLAAEMNLLLEPLIGNKSDIVVGSRISNKKNRKSITRFNALGNNLFNRTINFAMKSSITDSLSGYRAMYRKTFNELVLFSGNFEIEVEMTVDALAKGFRILEVPISYGTRNGSDTKLSPFNDGIEIAHTLIFILMNINPLKFFSIISLSFFIVGIYPAAFVLNEKISTGRDYFYAFCSLFITSFCYRDNFTSCWSIIRIGSKVKEKTRVFDYKDSQQ